LQGVHSVPQAVRCVEAVASWAALVAIACVYMYRPATVELTGTELPGASSPRGGCAWDFVNFRKKIHASRARVAATHVRLTVYPPRIQIADAGKSINKV
jgi:hypothetical protein